MDEGIKRQKSIRCKGSGVNVLDVEPAKKRSAPREKKQDAEKIENTKQPTEEKSMREPTAVRNHFLIGPPDKAERPPSSVFPRVEIEIARTGIPGKDK